MRASDPRLRAVIEAAAVPIPRGHDAGRAGGGTKHGTERNDNLLGAHGSDTIAGGGGDDVIWGDPATTAAGCAPST